MSKQVFILLSLVFCSFRLDAQVPQGINYQTVVRDNNNNLITNQNVTFRFSIISGSASGTIVYREVHNTNTNSLGLVNLILGQGTPVTGEFSMILWSNSLHFLMVELDPQGGSAYQEMGTSQLMSVPYALSAGNMSGWNLVGNTNTDSAINFIGTQDNQPMMIRTNNEEKMRITTHGQVELLNTGRSIFIGQGAGANDDLSDNENVFIGNSAGSSNTTGRNNTVSGNEALFSNITGNNNTASGWNALAGNTIGDGNTANGAESLRLNTTGEYNTANGMEVLYNNTTGSFNSANGYSALYYNSTGSFNTATGMQALYHNTTGNRNIANGPNSLYHNTTGSANIAIGDSALFYNHTSGNIGIGGKALLSNFAGFQNTAIGEYSLRNNYSGNSNTACGNRSLVSNTSGDENTALGYFALASNSIGYDNTAIGVNSLLFNLSGNYNTATGISSMRNNTTGNNNTAFGGISLFANTTGSYNTALGYSSYYTGTAYSYSTAIGFNSAITASNQIRIGDAPITSIGGYVGWSNLSDGRFKQNVQSNVPGLSFIKALNPVTYYLDMDALAYHLNTPDSLRRRDDEGSKSRVLQTGFIAQEVEQAAKSIGFEFSGVDAPKNEHDYYALRYAEFVVPLVKAVQEQQEMIEQQSAKILAQQKQLELLQAQVKRLVEK